MKITAILTLLKRERKKNIIQSPISDKSNKNTIKIVSFSKLDQIDHNTSLL